MRIAVATVRGSSITRLCTIGAAPAASKPIMRGRWVILPAARDSQAPPRGALRPPRGHPGVCDRPGGFRPPAWGARLAPGPPPRREPVGAHEWRVPLVQGDDLLGRADGQPLAVLLDQPAPGP